MRIKSYIIIILALVILAIALILAMFWLNAGQRFAEPAVETPAVSPELPYQIPDWQSYESDKLNFEIQYPKYLSLSEEATYYDLAGVYEKSEPTGGAVRVGIVRLSGEAAGAWTDVAVYAIHPQDSGAAADDSAAFIREFENKFPEYKEPGEKVSSTEYIKISGYDFKKIISESAAIKRITYIYSMPPKHLFIVSAKIGNPEQAALMQQILATFKAKQ